MTLPPKIRRLLERAAAAISGGFEERGIPAVLVGGTVVEFYTAGGYTTADIDMILPPLERREIETVMEELGFVRSGDYRHRSHPQIPFPVEFPPGPLQAGHLPVDKLNEINEKPSSRILGASSIFCRLAMRRRNGRRRYG